MSILVRNAFVLAVLILVTGCTMFRMPESSVRGSVSEPLRDLAPMRALLASDVRRLAETIGHRSVFDAARTEQSVAFVERRFAERGLVSRRRAGRSRP